MAGVDALFGDLGVIERFDGRTLEPAQLAGADALLVRSITRVDDALLADSSLRFVGTATSGFDHIDRDALERRGIPFAWAPGSNADSVVDYVFSVLCHHPQRLAGLLGGQRLGIIGYGHIGRRLHRRLDRLGIDVVAYDPWLDAGQHPALDDLAAVLACPVISIHAALTDASPWPSRHMLDSQALAGLPDQALLINAGRGELIATGELLELHAARPDVSLVLDVWEGEPNIDNGLLEAARFGTAHIAGYSYDGKLRASAMLRDALCNALDLDRATQASPLAPVEVELPAGLQAGELLCQLAGRVYDVAEDDRLLRAAVPGGFDALRKQYRQRRELSSLRIANCADLDAESVALCRALGCETDPC